MSSKLVGSDIPGLQVPVPLRFLWLFSGIILLALANANLAYMMTVDRVSDSTPTEAVSKATQVDGSKDEGEMDKEVDTICSLADVQCDSEPELTTKAQAKESPSVSPTIGAVDSDKLSTLRAVCARHNLAEQCAKDLYAIAWHESHFDCSVVGDSGRSFGCFQIQVKMHKVPKDFARDFDKAADWTLGRMIRNGYDKGYRTYAVKRHNGFGPMADRYASRVIATANSLK